MASFMMEMRGAMRELRDAQAQPPTQSPLVQQGGPSGRAQGAPGPSERSAPSAATAGLDPEEVARARALLSRPGVPPPQRARPVSVPGRRDDAAVINGVLLGGRDTVPPEPEVDELDVAAAPGFAALIRELRNEIRASGQTRGKPRPGFGLEGEDDLEGEGAGESVPGAKGIVQAEQLAAAMRAHPKSFADIMEGRLSLALDESSEGGASGLGIPPSHHAYRYLLGMPVGQQRSLGYLLTLLTHIHRASQQGQQDRVRHLALAGLAAGEQYLVDGNWRTAWATTALAEPPWDTWAGVSAAEAKKQVHSRLLDPRWIAALAARFRDEEALLKRRHVPNPKGKAEPP